MAYTCGVFFVFARLIWVLWFPISKVFPVAGKVLNVNQFAITGLPTFEGCLIGRHVLSHL